MLLKLLNWRFGEIDEELLKKVRGLSLEQVETLGKALLEFENIEDLQKWLQENLEVETEE
ncbi:MAG TPA: DUF4351 domain-containing protein [Nostocaceae cyanobacterium]|nr:DUF4351 domain-containing protein [Nostocaceae cyanobacterium]